jgi:hypothetical protein
VLGGDIGSFANDHRMITDRSRSRSSRYDRGQGFGHKCADQGRRTELPIIVHHGPILIGKQGVGGSIPLVSTTKLQVRSGFSRILYYDLRGDRWSGGESGAGGFCAGGFSDGGLAGLTLSISRRTLQQESVVSYSRAAFTQTRSRGSPGSDGDRRGTGLVVTIKIEVPRRTSVPTGDRQRPDRSAYLEGAVLISPVRVRRGRLRHRTRW